MEHLPTHEAVGIFTALLMVASAVGIAVKWVKVPYSIALVLVGLLIGTGRFLPPVEMTPQLILFVCLPALLFEASWNIRLQDLKQSWRPILILASIGVVLSMLICGWLMHRFGELAINEALIFGALISATDPISVLALFRRLGIDKRLLFLLEGESLFNDAIALVLFKFILSLTIVGVAMPLPSALLQLVTTVVGGVLIGLVVGFCACFLARTFDDRLLEITLTAVAAYGSYLLADQIGVSPVLAVLTAGIVLGNYGAGTAMSPTTRLAVNSFWEYAAFVVNSLVFLLIGLQIQFDLLMRYAPLIGVGIVAALLSRFATIYGLAPFLSKRRLPIPLRWRGLLAWGGLRGSVSMAIALSLPMNFPRRDELIVVTFGVVLFTLLVPGLTVEHLAKALHLISSDRKDWQYRALQAGLIAEKEAQLVLIGMRDRGTVSAKAFARLEAEIALEQERLIKEMESLHLADASIEVLKFNQARKQLLEVRKDAIVKAAQEEGLPTDLVQELVVDLDARLETAISKEQDYARRLGQGRSRHQAENS